MRISDWSSDVCSSDLLNELDIQTRRGRRVAHPLKRASKAIRQGLETGVTTIRQDDVIASVADALQYISYYHPMDYIRALGAAYDAEQGPAAKDAIAQILTNSRMCAAGHRPICQDTGIVPVFVEVGDRKSTRLNSSHNCATRMTSS